MGRGGKLTTRDIVLTALLAAVLIAGKEALAFLPNVEIVTLLIILYTLRFERLTPSVICVFAATECALYGIHLWTVMYFYCWHLLYLAVRLLRKRSSHLLWVGVSTLFGLLFGLLCAPVYFAAGGWAAAVGWFTAGIPYDLLHAAGNAVIALTLYVPLDRLFERLEKTPDGGA